MRLFKYKTFDKWARLENIESDALKKAISELEAGRCDANLGSGLYKMRVTRKGQGKRGSYRTLIAFKENERTFFLYGFAKNERDNIDEKEKMVYRKLARHYLTMSDSDLDTLIKNNEMIEIIK